MKIAHVGIGMLVAALAIGFSQVATAKNPPVAKLVQVEGTVEYSRNQKTWRPVSRTKYLFAGYSIRTGDDGSGKLVNQETGEAQELGSESEILIKDDGVELISGNLSEPKAESTSIFQSLANKFATAQRYTTVRRSVTTGDEPTCDNKVRTIREVTLSPSHPDLVWRNACPEFSYRLVIDGEAQEVSAQSNAEMIRVSVDGVEPGEHTYRVEVLDKDGTVYIPRSDSTFTWIDDETEAEIMADVKTAGDDVFVKTSLLEQEGLYIAAMDAYRGYFQEYPDDNDMRPLLIQSYQDLKLTDLRENEARLYNAGLEEDY